MEGDARVFEITPALEGAGFFFFFTIYGII